LLVAVLAILSLVSTACVNKAAQAERIARTATGGSASRGLAAISRYGCGSCHTIAGVSGAFGRVGPPLTGIGSRYYVAGVLPNTPSNLVRWIENPPGIDEHTVMPNLGVTHKDALDIAGYLYTLQ
jgi:mono/diheme cytochrome c family protein